MTADQRFLGMIIVVCGRTFIGAVIVVALWTGHPWGWRLAIASEGCAYLCANAQMMEHRAAALGLFGAAALFGLAAFLAILF